jgi:hypothetical protein
MFGGSRSVALCIFAIPFAGAIKIEYMTHSHNNDSARLTTIRVQVCDEGRTGSTQCQYVFGARTGQQALL